jgi:hypothetical protein
MADFALWATACETALWPAGTFTGAYAGNRRAAMEAVIDADPLATSIREFIAYRSSWTGTAWAPLGNGYRSSRCRNESVGGLNL